MSYLSLPSFDIADNTKGTISLWFRVSDDSVQKAIEHGENYPRTDIPPITHEILRGTIPLVTFGRQVRGTLWDSEGRLDCSTPPGAPFPQASYSFHPANPNESPMEPSHIGLSCYGDKKEKPALLMVFQTNTKASAQGLYFERTSCQYVRDPFPGSGVYVLHQVMRDVSYIQNDSPEAFMITPNFKVETDKWHHVVASWDFSNSVDVVAIQRPAGPSDFQPGDAISGACQFYYAFDDENKKGSEDISGMTDEFQPPGSWAYKGDNDVVPTGAHQADFEYSTSPIPTDGAGNPLVTGDVNIWPEWHWAASPLPLNGGPVGAPASASYVDNVYHVEMAELQFFVGLVLDTGDENNRRAFIDHARDSSGNPVRDENGNPIMRPVDPNETEKRLGRRPDILLHTAANWKTGKNTGEVGLERNPDTGDKLIESGQFEPIGQIKRFKPEPSLAAAEQAERVDA